MSSLKRWLPFMFKRGKASEDEGQNERNAVPVAHRPGAPAGGDLQRGAWPYEPFGLFADFDRWFGDFSPRRFLPTVDVADEGEALRISLELPGVAKDDLKLEIEAGVLSIRGEKRNADERQEQGVYRSERYYGAFERTIPLPEEVDAERAEAQYDNGVLNVRLPKRPAAQSQVRQIAVG